MPVSFTGRIDCGTELLIIHDEEPDGLVIRGCLAFCLSNKTDQYNTMARTKQSGKQKEAPLEDKDQQAGTMEKKKAKPDGDSDVSNDDSDELDYDDSDIGHKEHLLSFADDVGPGAAAEANKAVDRQPNSSISFAAGSRRRTDIAYEEERADSDMSDISSPFFEVLSSSDEADLEELRKKSPTYESMQTERHNICEFQMHN